MRTDARRCRHRLRALAALGLAAGLAGCGGTRTITVTRVRTVTAPTTPRACPASALGGSFAVVRGSAGAGNIVYALHLANRSGAACFLSGLPVVQLLDAHGSPLPTHATAAEPGRATAVRVVLDPGEAAVADARFSPDVPGPGEGRVGACEPTAATLRVSAPGGGAVDAAVEPPTPVCEHGALSFSVYRAAR